MTHKVLLAMIAIQTSACSGIYVSPRPYLCTEWTLERADSFALLPDDAPVAELVVEWNETCARNAALVGREWVPPVGVEPKQPWWRFW